MRAIIVVIIIIVTVIVMVVAMFIVSHATRLYFTIIDIIIE